MRKPTAGKLPRYTKMQKRDMCTAYLMLLPAVALLTVFVVAPLVMAIEKSFYDWNFYGNSTFVGLDNFRVIVVNKSFRRAVVNALKFVVILVPLQIVLQFAFAHLLKSLSVRFSNAIKTAIYIPGIIAGIVAGIIFMFIFEYKGGLINQLLTSLGLPRIAFLNNGFWAMFSIVAPTLWLGFGGGAILNYAGLISVPAEYYEAASIDGAGAFRKLISITLPQMKNIFVLQCISMVTGALQMFEVPMMMTNGGPRESTLTPMLY
ncbi:MAG: sugar ABC transporter permease, partial [Acutalibacter sp.]|nr:sugar ABC transporter permease [Acutalibacter sp.]